MRAELERQKKRMERARTKLIEQQQLRDRQLNRERESMTARVGGARPVALLAASRHTWVRRTPRDRTNPTTQPQVVEMMETEQEVHRDRDNLTYKDITLMEGTDNHLLEGQGGNNNRA